MNPSLYSPLTWHETPEYKDSRTTPLLEVQREGDRGNKGGSHDHNHRRTTVDPVVDPKKHFVVLKTEFTNMYLFLIMEK